MHKSIEIKTHIGKYVHTQIEAHHLSGREIARRLHISDPGLVLRCKRPHYGTVHDLMKTSIVMEQNLFDIVMATLDTPNLAYTDFRPISDFDKLAQENENIKEQVAQLRNEIETLKEEKKTLYGLLEKLGSVN